MIIIGSQFFKEFVEEAIAELRQSSPLIYSKFKRHCWIILQGHQVSFWHWCKAIRFDVRAKSYPEFVYSIAEVAGTIAHVTGHLESRSDDETYPFLLEIMATADLHNDFVSEFWTNYLEENYGFAINNCWSGDRIGGSGQQRTIEQQSSRV